MPSVTYIKANNEEVTLNVPSGMTLMHGATLNNVDGLLAECGGAMICATCHCYIDRDFINLIKPASNEEREKLRIVNTPKSNSRLACQVRVTDEIDGIRVYLPASQVLNR